MSDESFFGLQRDGDRLTCLRCGGIWSASFFRPSFHDCDAALATLPARYLALEAAHTTTLQQLNDVHAQASRWHAALQSILNAARVETEEGAVFGVRRSRE